ncbi:MAG TPA: ribosome-associated translation inhibitor RaiA [Candidatus Paceibacterota bacterium]|nr:ribosome-associated translation inhibitor RaiA [Candidatus Paceibacterota bacterium]
MNINIKGTGIELTPEIRSYLDKKIASLEKFVTEEDTGATANIEIGKTTNKHKSGIIFFTEINFTIRKADLRVKAFGDSLMASMDKAKDMALERLRTEKDRTASHQL